MRGIAELVIQDYILDLKEPKCNWRKSRFDQLSYSRWAANEVLRCVREQKSIPSITVIEEFVKRMDSYACMNSKNSYIFSVAHDIAEDILDIFLAMK